AYHLLRQTSEPGSRNRDSSGDRPTESKPESSSGKDHHDMRQKAGPGVAGSSRQADTPPSAPIIERGAV
ncbi:MAG TPA: hypothetical protein VGE52_14180, partial [Pirellulales bacterium]